MAKVMTIEKVSQLDVIKGVRKDWGTFNPIQRVKASKKVYKRKAKHSKNFL